MKGYVAHECITFCSRYFQGVKTVFNRPQRNDAADANEDMYLFGTTGQPKVKVEMAEVDKLNCKQAHQYVFLYLDDIGEYHRFVRITNLSINISFNTIKD